jgi:SAM-dependent methyltransferase
MGMEVFSEHYRKNGWGCCESVSGEGSTIEQTAVIREALPKIVRDFQVRTLLDIPCGDFNWMKLLELPVQYTGADIVEEIIAANQKSFGNPSRSFIRLDLTVDTLPTADLVLCRDCLFHLSYAHIFQALANIKRSGSRFLLTTTNMRLIENKNIVTGEWRRLNLLVPPFSLPKPLLLIDEKCPNAVSPDKHIGLWRISDL